MINNVENKTLLDWYTNVYVSDNLSKAEKKKEKQKISGPLLTACDEIRDEFAHCNISIRVRLLSQVSRHHYAI